MIVDAVASLLLIFFMRYCTKNRQLLTDIVLCPCLARIHVARRRLHLHELRTPILAQPRFKPPSWPAECWSDKSYSNSYYEDRPRLTTAMKAATWVSEVRRLRGEGDSILSTWLRSVQMSEQIKQPSSKPPSTLRRNMYVGPSSKLGRNIDVGCFACLQFEHCFFD